MADDKTSWWKIGCFGCLGVIGLGALIVGVSALVAWRGLETEQIEEQFLERDLPVAAAGVEGGEESGSLERTDLPSGRIILELTEAGFEIEPGAPGEGMRIESEYDTKSYALEDSLEIHDDGSWTYRVRFERKVSGMVAMLRGIMGGEDPIVRIYLPVDVPFGLELDLEEGGAEIELGGLWITAADIRCNKGGIELSLDEPLREPMERLTISGSMGGIEARRLGHASPAEMDIRFRMGGAELDLTGDWRQDSDIRLDVTMGGMEVHVPDDVAVEGAGGRGRGIRSGSPEVPLPTLRFTVSSRMGEIAVDY